MKGNAYNHKLPNVNVLQQHYFNENMSASDIAKLYNVTTGAVLIKFRRYNIKRRTLQESQALKANYFNISEELIHFLNGLLLGDGCLVYTTNKKSCWYGHSDKNKEYLEWLQNNFRKFGIKCSNIKTHTNNCYALKTLSYRNFTKIRELWYPNGKKKIPDINITPITLFNWYIGDGSYSKGKHPKVVICSQFDEKGKDTMAKKFKNIGIKNSVYWNCIYIKSRDIFFKYVLNHNYKIPKCYKYKFN